MSAFASRPDPLPARPESKAAAAPSKQPSGSAEDQGPEPFGQSGVRQHLVRWLSWVCLVAAILAAAMWYRSTFFYDSAQWHGKNQALNIRSIHSRVMIDLATYDFRTFSLDGWSYRGGYTRQVRDGWADTLWRRIGVEAAPSPADPMAQHGFWIRIKWQFIVASLLVIPLLRILKLAIDRWREDRE